MKPLTFNKEGKLERPTKYMSRTTDNLIDYQNKIELAEECGLVQAGDYENGEPRFIGNNKSWALFNDGGL